VFDQAGIAVIETHAVPTETAPKGGFIWFDVTDPTAEGMALLQSRFSLHPLAVEDTLHAHQRSKAESQGGPGEPRLAIAGRADGPAGSALCLADAGTRPRLKSHQLPLAPGRLPLNLWFDFVSSVKRGSTTSKNASMTSCTPCVSACETQNTSDEF